MIIQKRNKQVVPFDENKIINAINAAMIEVDGKLYESDTAFNIASDIKEEIAKSPIIVDVETIQNWVEEELMKSERPDVARAYIRFRYKKEVARNYTNDFMNAVAEKLQAKSVENQNANVDERSFGGRIGEASRLLMKKYALDYCVSDMARRNHENNEIYIHDLDSYAVGMHNCLSIPFDDLLAKGFNTRQTDVRPANSVNTAFQLVAVIFQLQSLQQFGGVSATHLDWTMVPYVRKSFYKHYRNAVLYVADCHDMDKDYLLEELNDTMSVNDEKYKKYTKLYNYAMDMTVKEVHQAVEGMYHNLNY